MFFFFVGRYVAKGKGILQRHHLIDELEAVVGEDKGLQMLKDGFFGQLLKSSQVINPFFFILLCFAFSNT